MGRYKQANGLERLTIAITQRAFNWLIAECRRRYEREARHMPYGGVISELIEANIVEDENEEADGVAVPPKKLPNTAARRKFARTA